MKTSGSKGFHIAVPLDGKADSGEVAGFAHAVGTILVARDPEHLTQEFSKADRGGRILVDTGRNGYSATFAAAYAVRAKPGAPVSAPCTWEELERGEAGPRTFTLRTMAGRIAGVGDLWADMRKRKRSLRRADRAGAEDEGRRLRRASRRSRPLAELPRWSLVRGSDSLGTAPRCFTTELTELAEKGAATENAEEHTETLMLQAGVAPALAGLPMRHARPGRASAATPANVTCLTTRFSPLTPLPLW